MICSHLVGTWLIRFAIGCRSLSAIGAKTAMCMSSRLKMARSHRPPANDLAAKDMIQRLRPDGHKPVSATRYVNLATSMASAFEELGIYKIEMDPYVLQMGTDGERKALGKRTYSFFWMNPVRLKGEISNLQEFVITPAEDRYGFLDTDMKVNNEDRTHPSRRHCRKQG